MNWLLVVFIIILVLITIIQQTQIVGLRNYVHEIDHILLRVIVAAGIEKQMGIAEGENKK